MNKSSIDPRRVYVEQNRPLVCFAGTKFNPLKSADSKINVKKPVRVKLGLSRFGRQLVEVVQGRGKNLVKETWIQIG